MNPSSHIPPSVAPRASRRIRLGFASLLALFAGTLPGHAANVPMPVNLTGPGGANWTGFNNYSIEGLPSFCFSDADTPYGVDAFDFAGQILINGVAYANPDGDVDLTGNTITSDPAVVSGLTVSVQYTALTGSQTLRCLVTMTNASGSPLVGLPVSYRSNWGSDGATTIRATSSGDLSYGLNDIWSVTSDSGDFDPVNISVYGSPGNTALSAITGTVFDAAGTEGLGLTYNLDFAPGQTRHLLFFHEMADTSANAISQAQVYNNPLSGERAAGLPAQGIVNFSTSAPKVYVVSTDGDPDFYAYDPTANSWSAKAGITTYCQLAADQFGDVYALAADNTIKRYDPVGDAWTTVAPGPGIGSSSANLEVLNDGRFFVSIVSSWAYWVFDGVSWSSGSLGFPASQLGDYDPGSNVLVVGQPSSEIVHRLDPTTFAVVATYSNGATTASERRRAGSLLNGSFYQKDWVLDLRSVDLSSPSNPFVNEGDGPGNLWFPSSAADRSNGLLYLAGIGSGGNADPSILNFEVFDPSTGVFTALATMPSGLGYHSSAVVGGGGGAPPPSPEIAVADVTAGAPGVDLADGQAGAVDFGCAQPGSSLTRNFEIRNEGTGDLVLAANALTLPTGYEIVGGWPAVGTVTIPAGQSWSDVVGSTLAVHLSAAAEGVYAGSWSLANNDPDEDPFDFPITGIIDGTNPTLNGLPAGFLVTAASGCSAVVNWTAPTPVDNLDPSPTLAQTGGPAPGSTLPVGNHVIEYSASDCAGNVAVGSFTVTVIETVPPMLMNCPPRVSVINLPPGVLSTLITYTAPTAVDNCDPNPTVSCSPPSGLSFGPGVHFFTCVAEDWSGNQTVETFRVVVLESQLSPSQRLAEIVAERTEAAPGTGGGTFSVVNHAFLNEAGGVLIEATVSGAGPGAVGLWKNVGSGLELVTRKDSVAPGSGGFTFTRFDDVMLNDAGDVAFEGYLDAGAPTTANVGHWSEGSGALGLSVLEGDTAPGAGAPVFSILHEPAFDGTGATLTPANLRIDNVGVSTANDTGIWRKPAGGGPLEEVAREGSPIGATLPGANYGQVGSRVVANASGEVAFFSFLEVGSGGVTLADNGAVFAGAPGAVELVARENQTAPGPDPAVFSNFTAESINNNGRIAFEATLRTGGGGSAVGTSNNTGIYANSNGVLELVAREGDSVHPCGPPGTEFSSFRSIFIDDGGDVFFHAYLTGPSVGSKNDGGFWRWRSSESRLEPVLIEGGLAPSTQGAVFTTLIDFAVSDGGAQVVTATLSPGVGDCTLGNNFGLWMDNGGNGVPVLRVREGDGVDLSLPSETPALTVLFIDRTTNLAGGSGGHGKVLNDFGEVIVRTSFNQNTSGAIILSGGPLLPPGNPEGPEGPPLPPLTPEGPPIPEG